VRIRTRPPPGTINQRCDKDEPIERTITKNRFPAIRRHLATIRSIRSATGSRSGRQITSAARRRGISPPHGPERRDVAAAIRTATRSGQWAADQAGSRRRVLASEASRPTKRELMLDQFHARIGAACLFNVDSTSCRCRSSRTANKSKPEAGLLHAKPGFVVCDLFQPMRSWARAFDKATATRS